jgi:hypothetical protein
MLKPLASTLGKGLRETVQRFPVPVLSALAFSIISIGLPTYGQLELETHKDVLLAGLFCTTFWFISVTLAAESRGWNKTCLYGIGLLGSAAMALYLANVPKIDIPFALLGAACFLSMFIAPYLRSGVSAEAIWVFNYRMWLRIALSVLVGLVLFLGLIAVNQSLKFLFGIPQPYDIAGYIWLFVATFFSPLFAMAGIPRDFAAENVEYPKPIRLIVSFILLPLLLVYTVVLYLYTGKIVVTWTLPEGGVVYLVSGFGIIGTMVWLASVPLHAEGGFVATFARNFYRMLLLPLVLLAVGIGLRIKEYGVTEERYVVVLCLVWLVLAAAFSLVASSRHAPRFIYLSLISLLFLASAGPWGATGVSNWSQLNRLEAVMQRVGLLVDGKPVKLQKPAGPKETAEISDIMDYFVSVDRLDEAAKLFGPLPPAYLAESNYYSRTMLILEKAGVVYIEKWNRDRYNDGVRAINYGEGGQSVAYETQGFDYLITNGYAYPDYDSKKTYALTPDFTLTAEMNWGPMILVVTDEKKGRTVKFDLSGIVKAYAGNEAQKPVPLTLTQDGLSVKLKIMAFNAEELIAEQDSLRLTSISYDLYVKSSP